LRNLNVSDFLTNVTNLPWSEATQFMREQYRAQTGLDPAHAGNIASRSGNTIFQDLLNLPSGWLAIL